MRCDYGKRIKRGKSREIASLSADNARQFSDGQLAEMDRKLAAKVQEKKNTLAQIERQNSPQNMPQKYYDTKRDQQNLEANHRVVINEIAKRKAASQRTPQRTAVNSFGEATGRYITSDTYERQQKRLSRQIMKFIGG